MRVHWVAVPKALRARRVNRRRSGGAPAAVGEGGLSLISSSPAFEFFELWKAGH
eukprot:COSAG01_NODE_6932_length_3434_cov_10.042879_5_plen_53_part_01